MTEPNRTESLATDELSIDELNSVVGGTDKTPPKPKNPTPPAKPQPSGTFEIDDFSFDIEQTIGAG
jgi:bacteriocin-like protein